MAYRYKWQWNEDLVSGGFVDYDKATSDQVEAAFLAGGADAVALTKSPFFSTHPYYTITFSNLMQNQTVTDNHRRVRRIGVSVATGEEFMASTIRPSAAIAPGTVSSAGVDSTAEADDEDMSDGNESDDDTTDGGTKDRWYLEKGKRVFEVLLVGKDVTVRFGKRHKRARSDQPLESEKNTWRSHKEAANKAKLIVAAKESLGYKLTKHEHTTPDGEVEVKTFGDSSSPSSFSAPGASSSSSSSSSSASSSSFSSASTSSSSSASSSSPASATSNGLDVSATSESKSSSDSTTSASESKSSSSSSSSSSSTGAVVLEKTFLRWQTNAADKFYDIRLKRMPSGDHIEVKYGLWHSLDAGGGKSESFSGAKPGGGHRSKAEMKNDYLSRIAKKIARGYKVEPWPS